VRNPSDDIAASISVLSSAVKLTGVLVGLSIALPLWCCVAS
jgi:hypothetical protein